MQENKGGFDMSNSSYRLMSSVGGVEQVEHFVGRRTSDECRFQVPPVRLEILFAISMGLSWQNGKWQIAGMSDLE